MSLIAQFRTSSSLRLEAGVVPLCHESLSSKDFTEVMCPKLISVATEGGANAFGKKYFEKQEFLAQSPQALQADLYAADFGKVI